MRTFVSLLLLGTVLVANTSAMPNRDTKLSGEDPELARKTRRFSPTVLTANTATLSPGDRKALIKIIEAALQSAAENRVVEL